VTVTYGTLSFVPGFPVEVEVVRAGISTEPESGFVATRTLRANVSRQSNQPQTRTWRVQLGPDGLAQLRSERAAAKGGALPLSWTPPPPDDGAAIPVRFLDGTLRVRREPGALFRAEVELEEVT
jgi:hypothetical protein